MNKVGSCDEIYVNDMELGNERLINPSLERHQDVIINIENNCKFSKKNRECCVIPCDIESGCCEKYIEYNINDNILNIEEFGCEEFDYDF